ncbi:MAG: ATPase, central domain protein [Nevskia sp.]|nr:ATPase, central domain protein [Nevskia sp.]
MEDFVQLARLAVGERSDDVRLFLARLVRRYRATHPDLAEKFDTYLKSSPARGSSPLRRAAPSQDVIAADHHGALPLDQDSRLSLLKVYTDTETPEPLLSAVTRDAVGQLILERTRVESLRQAGLRPTRSAIFLGPPGVGKTLTARWVAAQLSLPLYVLDLTAVMSSYLGRSGNNLRAAIDYAKRSNCILLLDEIDAIAKRRSDDADIGELKRLVTVVLQEVDEWPATGLLLAATNHPELIDPALWRRFDAVVPFELPDLAAVKTALKRYLEPEYERFERWADVLAYALLGESFSAIEKTAQRFRRTVALELAGEADLVEEFLKSRAVSLAHPQRVELATLLSQQTRLSQHRISEITGVSRDTIRKYGGTASKNKRNN